MNETQQTLGYVDEQAYPQLWRYDWIVVNSSGGKDSQSMLEVVCRAARQLEILHRVVVVHCDLGRAEWPGVLELAREQAEHYGVRFEVVSRTQGDLLDHVRDRGKWPSSTIRYCTSDHKRGQAAKVLTMLADEVRAKAPKGYQVKILNCMGFRADESPARAKRVPFEVDKRNTNTRRHVDQWLPIHALNEQAVWVIIKKSGVRHHEAYDLGMPRLSCVFCIFAGDDALLLAGEHNPELLDQYVQIEQDIGHTFKHGQSIESIRTRLASGERSTGKIHGWCM